MALIKIKQINNSPAATGGIIVFDGSNNVWSNNDDGAVQLSSGTTAQRPTGSNGMIRYNTTLGCTEAFIDGSWSCLVNTGDITGKNFQLIFSNDGILRNSWFDYGGNNILSNGTFAIIPWDCELAGLTYTNSLTGVDTDIEIYATPQGSDPSVTKTLKFTWSLTNVRNAARTNFTPGQVTFNIGDKIGVFSRDQGDDANDVVLSLYFNIIDNTTTNSTDNVSGDMSV